MECHLAIPVGLRTPSSMASLHLFPNIHHPEVHHRYSNLTLDLAPRRMHSLRMPARHQRMESLEHARGDQFRPICDQEVLHDVHGVEFRRLRSLAVYILLIGASTSLNQRDWFERALRYRVSVQGRAFAQFYLSSFFGTLTQRSRRMCNGHSSTLPPNIWDVIPIK